MRYGILGPVEVWDGERSVAVGGPQQRKLLAVLLLSANRVVSTERLVEVLWGDDPPPTVRSLLQGCVAALRHSLRDIGRPLVTRPPGYQLEVAPGELDLARFDQLVTAAAGADPGRAAKLLREALSLWRGPALGGATADRLRSDVAALEERRLAALQDRIDLDLRLGHHAGLVGELNELVWTHPLRERPWAQLMRALHESGRPAEALAAYRQLRENLVEQLGVEPGPAVQQLHRAILTGAEPIAPAIDDPPAAVQPLPAQLPPTGTGFTGRTGPLKRLDELLSQDGYGVAIGVISGTAGIGKTTLAVHWGHRMRDRFPDGQLFVDLRGFDPTGSIMDSSQALRTFLVALGVPAERIPANQSAQVGLYRSLLADKRMLIVLDNARDAEQARALLPGAPSCLAIVTSRNQLTGLIVNDGAHSLTLDLLTTNESYDLLAHRLGPDRVEAEPGAVAEIIARCAGLPLALAIVAARAAAHPRLALHTVATQLHDAQLSAFDGGDPASDLRAVFSWSYHTLGPEAARLLRLLGLHPGPDISAAAAASLAAVPAPQGHCLLAELARAHLIVEDTPGRYRFHDLLRAYATELTNTCDPDTERQAALHRMLDHYLHTAQPAALILEPQRDSLPLAAPVPGVTPEDLAGDGAAMAWLAAEYPVLLAAVARAGGAGFEAYAWRLASAVAAFFAVRGGYLHEWATVQRDALEAARRAADLRGQANAHRSLALVYARMDRDSPAQLHGQHALDLYRELGDHTGQAHTNLHLGWMCSRQERAREGLRHAEEALRLYRIAGNRTGQANALNAVGWSHSQLGDYPLAVTICEQALDLLVRIGDRNGQAHTWNSLGHAHRHLGHHREAITSYGRALDLHRASGDRPGEADTLNQLGDAHAAAGDPDAAHDAWRSAVAILAELNNPDADRINAKLRSAATGYGPVRPT